MGWFSKKEARKKESSQEDEHSMLPELPEQNFPDLPSLDESHFNKERIFTKPIQENTSSPKFPPAFQNEEFRKSLPSLPFSNNPGALEKNMIKETVNSPPLNPGITKQKKPDEKRTLEISDWGRTHSEAKAKKAEPLFIQIEKFEEASESFEQIKEKLSEVENSLKKIKDIKIKEEKELEEWERELEVIKSRIDSIDNSIFNKIED